MSAAIEWIWPVGLFALGLAFGSFANVCIWRIPRRKEVVVRPSHCPVCETPIAWYDNIPVVSYLILGGRCRRCRGLISLRYPAVELLSGGLFLLGYHLRGAQWTLAGVLAFLWLLMVISFIDLEHFLIPDQLTLTGTGLGLLLAGLANLGLPLTELTASHLGRQMLPMLDSVLGSLLGGGFLFLAAWAGKRAFKQDAMGGGDIKLALMIGAFLGWKGVVIALFLSFLAGSLVSLALMALGRIKGKRAIVPFGPFLAIGSILTLWAGDAVITWYLHMLFGT